MNKLILALLLTQFCFPAAAQVVASAQRPAAVPEQPDRAKPVPPGPARPIQLPSVQEATLANGMRLALIELHRFPLVSAVLVFPLAGDAHDPAGKSGLSGVVADLMQEGAGKLDSRKFAEAVKDLGATVEADSSADSLSVEAFSMKENFDKVLGLAASMARSPVLPADQLERIRMETLEGLKEEKGSPGTLAQKQAARRVFGAEHPYGRSADEKSVQSITHQDAVNFHAAQVQPQGAILAVSGDINMEELRKLAEAHFGGWSAKPQAPAVAVAKTGSDAQAAQEKGMVIDVIDFPGAPQSAVRVGRVSLARNDPDFITAVVLNFILGQAPMMSRLDSNLRERHSWTYGARSKLLAFKSAGLFLVTTDVQVDATAKALKEIFLEIKRMREEEVPSAELEMLKRMYAGMYLMKQQTVQEVAAQAAGVELNGLSADTMAVYRDKVMAVTAADILRVANKYWTAQELKVVVAGDAAKIRGELSEIAPVRVLDAEGNPKAQGAKAPAARSSRAP